jgi:nucleotide-binding universal stress UspA family protein
MPSIKNVLCPVDFSDISRHAFDRAVAIARANQAVVTALHIVQVQTAATLLPYMAPESLGPFPLPEIDRDRIATELKSFLALDQPLDVQVVCLVTDAPDVHREVLVHADRLPADLIVMGTHGRSGFQRLVLGSVTEKVLRKARCPVLTVPGTLPDVVPVASAPFRRILCAADFSECSVAGLRYAQALAEQHHAQLAVVHVIEEFPAIYDPLIGPPVDFAAYRASAETVSRKWLRDAVPASVRRVVKVEELLTFGKPHQEIVRLSEEWGSDLIVLGIHGRNVVDRLVFGSTAERVVRHAPCPVLTVRNGAHAASAAA